LAGDLDMSARVYDADIYSFSRMPRHYWALTAGPPEAVESSLDQDVAVDVAVIGGGYTGLFAAHRLTSRHGLSVAVLEAGAGIGWGASGANAGFVSMGGNKLEIDEMVRRVGEMEARRYWTTQVAAVDELRAFIADNAIACEVTGYGHLCIAHHPSVAPALAAEAEVLSKRFGVEADYIPPARLHEEFHDGPESHGALRTKRGFAMHPTRLVRGLARVAKASGAAIYANAEVVGWRREDGRHRLTTAGGVSIAARRVLLATNGYTPNGLYAPVAFRSLPAISSIIVTQAYAPAELDARGFRSEMPAYSSRNLIHYYRRLPDGRILFGQRGDTRGMPDAARAQSEQTLASLKRVLPAFADAEIAYAWRGLVCLTARRTLALGLDPDDATVAFAFGCHGSGTATMSWSGRLAADLIAGATTEKDVPALFRGLPPRLPPANIALRWGLKTAYAFYGLRDVLHI
jgi:glycine/D-amino acid oxidase-like deaminating enzyme